MISTRFYYGERRRIHGAQSPLGERNLTNQKIELSLEEHHDQHDLSIMNHATSDPRSLVQLSHSTWRQSRTYFPQQFVTPQSFAPRSPQLHQLTAPVYFAPPHPMYHFAPTPFEMAAPEYFAPPLPMHHGKRLRNMLSMPASPVRKRRSAERTTGQTQSELLEMPTMAKSLMRSLSSHRLMAMRSMARLLSSHRLLSMRSMGKSLLHA